MIGDPLVFVVFANFDLFSPEVEKADFNPVTHEALAALPKDKDILFIAIPYREADLRQVAAWIPGGKWREVYRRNQPNEILYFSYLLTKEQLAQFKP